PSQTADIKQLLESRRADFKAIHEQVRAKFGQLKMLLSQPNPDPATIGRAALELKTIHDQAKAKQAEVQKQFLSLLNPAQQQAVNSIQKQADTFLALRRIGLLRAPETGTNMAQNLPANGVEEEDVN